ncbi:hypothetical protein H0694_004448 [Salmonella enterica subsp. enterica serovar Thompson]|nr:hypothetical protein [Salmonella enterica subsp. enterica serovar Thompson]
MKNIKKLIIASVLSMITASCYAGSIVVGSEQQSSVDIGFVSPQQLSVTFAPVAGLKAGVIKSNTDIATIAVSSVAAKQFAIAADFKAKDVMNGDTWTLNDKLGVKLAGDQNVPADVFPMTVNIAAYQA